MIVRAYAYCGDAIRSAVPLPELQPFAAGEQPARTWTCGPARWPDAGGRLVQRWTTDTGETWLEIRRDTSGLDLRFSIGVAFRIHGHSISWRGDCNATPETVRHLLLDQVLPLAMSADGDFVLHAAAVEVAGGVMVFAGPSGRGKSTLAAACVASGATLVADDCVPVLRSVDGIVAQPSYPGLRLWNDSAARVRVTAARTPVASYTGKLRVASDVATSPSPVRGIFLLDRRDVPGAAAVRAGAGAVVDLIRFAFRVDPGDRAAIAADFSMAAELVDRGLVHRLIVPDTLDALDAVVATLDRAQVLVQA